MSYLNFSKRWAGYLSRETGLQAEQEIVLAYAIEVLTLYVLNVFGTLLLGAFFGVLSGTAACLVVAMLFRHSAGGVHTNSPWSCAAISIVTFPMLALLGALFSHWGQGAVDMLSAGAFGVGMAAMMLLAPVDSPAAPIISPVRRRKLKIIAIVFVVLVTVVALLLRESWWQNAATIQACLALTLLWVSFMLTSWGRGLMNLIDKLTIQNGRR